MRHPIRSWITSTLTRHFPDSPAQANRTLRLDIARNEHFSFQVAIRRNAQPEKALPMPVNVSMDVDAPRFWHARIRRVGYVPVARRSPSIAAAETDAFNRIPGFVPDPLFEDTDIVLPALETHAFWISVEPIADVPPGIHSIDVVCRTRDQTVRRHTARVSVHDVTLRKRKNFRVTNWFYCDALLDYYGCQAFDARFWQILPGYLKNLAKHGQDTVYTPLLTQATDGIKRPTQLLKIRRTPAGRYRFDWNEAGRFINVARKSGIAHFEWPHLFTQWGAANAIRAYHGQGQSEKCLWPAKTTATSGVYRRFLEDLLPALYSFLEREKLLKKSYFHISDEPREEHLDNYRRARTMIRSIAPWMKTMDALSDVVFARNGLTDIPVPAVNHAMPFIEAGIPSWCYYCCSQRGPYINRLLDTPPAKIRMNGWLFYRFGIKGFLHWGCNYWYRRASRQLIDPFFVQDAGSWPNWPCGDPFILYPGPSGPIDSIRWEVFGESLQDYALLQTLGIDPGTPSFAGIKDFAHFPKSSDWIRQSRRKLLKTKSI